MLPSVTALLPRWLGFMQHASGPHWIFELQCSSIPCQIPFNEPPCVKLLKSSCQVSGVTSPHWLIHKKILISFYDSKQKLIKWNYLIAPAITVLKSRSWAETLKIIYYLFIRNNFMWIEILHTVELNKRAVAKKNLNIIFRVVKFWF